MTDACKRCLIFALLAFAAGLAACTPAYDTARFKADFARGVAAYDAQDYKTAAAYWAPLAERYDLAAMRNMGNLYRRGLGVEKDVQKALAYYEAAAKRGFAPAQYAAAMMYVSNDGIAYDGDKAIYWLGRAAKNGFAPAAAQLKRMQMPSQLF